MLKDCKLKIILSVWTECWYEKWWTYEDIDSYDFLKVIIVPELQKSNKLHVLDLYSSP